MFPKALAKLGMELHVVTSTSQIYYYLPNYDEVYKPYLGPKFVDSGTKEIDGYTLHRLPFFETKNIYRGPGIAGLYDYLIKLKPDVIQTLEIRLDSTFLAAKYARDYDCPFFTECHTHASIFGKDHKKSWKRRLKNALLTFDPSLRLINKTTRICYPIASDVAEIAMSNFKVPAAKIKVQSLGVDTDTFFPPDAEEQQALRNKIRESFGFAPSDIVCIYTGRFTKDKNPQCLAKAINELNENGLPFKGLFIGNGTEEDIRSIQSMTGCKTGAFVPAKELPGYYWSADIGVWPREESTSQLDAAACGLPLILSNRIKVVERIEGNGLLYEEGNHLDMAKTLRKMSDSGLRKKMSQVGIEKIKTNFSWATIAAQRLKDYRSFLTN
jgi:glycosyltransferase involved in cell wall biosynthesis